MPVRFCLLSTFYPPWNFGGDGIQVQRLARGLAASGHEVTVVHSREGYEAMGGPPHAPSDRDGDVRLVAIDAGPARLSPMATYLTGRPLLARPQLAAAMAEGFDVLHFHNPSLLGGPAVLRMGDGVKLYTAHEQWLVCPTHVLWQDQRRLCIKPHCVTCTLRHGRPPQLWRPSRLLERSVAELDLLIAPSETSAALHRRFAKVVRIAQLPHFLPDPGEPSGAAPDEPPYVLFAGRLEPIKGIDTLIAVAHRFPGVRLVVAGAGSLEEKLRREAAALALVEFAGWQDVDGLDRLYRGALAAVVPSPGHESFGLVAIEALARGVPAIVRDFGALGELAAASEAVLGYRTDDELVGILGDLAASPQRRRALGQTARADFLERYTEQRHVRDYLALVRECAVARGDTALADRAGAAGDRVAAA